MPITGLNHAVLFVRDIERSRAFYVDVLGFTVTGEGLPGATFLRAPGSGNDHDLALFAVGAGAAASPAGRGSVGLYHLAWQVDTLAELARLEQRLAQAGALTGNSDHGTTKGVYGRDPDGLEFELTWVVPADRLDAATLARAQSVAPLDLDTEMQRYGAATPSGG